MVRLETALDDCLAQLTERSRRLDRGVELSLDDLDSIASSTSNLHAPPYPSHTVGVAARDREVKRLRLKLTKAEQENLVLRQQVEHLQALLAQQGVGSVLPNLNEETKVDKSNDKRINLSEGNIWSLMKDRSVAQT